MNKPRQSGECIRALLHASLLCTLILIVLSLGSCGRDSPIYLTADELSSDTGSEEAGDGRIRDANSDDKVAADGDVTGLEDGSDGGTADAASADGEGITLYVYVCGAVQAPGVYELDAGSRICDAIDAAGGLSADACTTYWNQAASLTDGQMINVPTQAEVDEGLVQDAGTDGTAGTATGVAGSSATDGSADAAGTDSASGSADGRININTASQDELTQIPGIGVTRAQAIIAYREEHGAFASIEDITNVSGIGDGLFAKMKDSITVD